MAADLVIAENLLVSKKDLVLPDTLEGLYAYLRTVQTQLETVNTITYWQAGAVLAKMKASFEIEKPAEAASRETGIKERLLRYCRQVFEAFEIGDLRAVCSKGMQWSTVRELASDNAEPFREMLLQRFLEDRYTDLEVRDIALKLRAGTPMSVLIGEDGELVEGTGEGSGSGEPGEPGELKQHLDKARKKVAKLSRDCAAESKAFNERLTTDFADALFTSDGSDDQDVIEALSALETVLHGTISESISLANAVHVMCGKSDYPFDGIDTMLNEIRTRFAVGAAPVEN